MSTAEILSLVSLICFILAGVFLVLAVGFWFFFKIPTVIGDLSGRTARKSIAKRRQANERTGEKGYRPSATNAARGKLTDTMEQPPKQKKQPVSAEPHPTNVGADRPGTGILSDNRAQAMQTTETAPLDSGTTELLIDENATAPLQMDANASAKRREGGKKLTMINEVMLIHTNEVIGNL